MIKKIVNTNGYALILAILTVLVISILGITLMSSTTLSKKITDITSVDQSVIYIAESGLTQKRSEIAKIEDIYNTYRSQQLEKEKQKNGKMTSYAFVDEFKDLVADELASVMKKTTYVSDNSQCLENTVCLKIFDLENAYATVDTKVTINENDFKYRFTSTGYIGKHTRKVTTSASYRIAASAYDDVIDSFSKYSILAIDGIYCGNCHLLGILAFTDKPTLQKDFPFNVSSVPPLTYFLGSVSKTKYYPCDKWSYDVDEVCLDATYKSTDIIEENKDLIFHATEIPILDDFPKQAFPVDRYKQIFLWNGVKPDSVQEKLPLDDVLNGDYFITMDDLLSASSEQTNKTIDIASNNVNLYISDGFSLGSQFKLNITGSGKLTIYSPSFHLFNEAKINFNNNFVTINATNNVSLQQQAAFNSSNSVVIHSDIVKIDDLAVIQIEKNLQLDAYNTIDLKGSSALNINRELQLTTKNFIFSENASIIVKKMAELYVENTLNLKSSKPIKTSATNIFYTGREKPFLSPSFSSTMTFDSLYSGINLSRNNYYNGAMYIRAETPPDGTKVDTSLLFNGTDNIVSSYVYAPYSKITLINNATLGGSIFCKEILIDGFSTIGFRQKIYQEHTPTNQKGKIDASFEETTSMFGIMEIN